MNVWNIYSSINELYLIICLLVFLDSSWAILQAGGTSPYKPPQGPPGVSPKALGGKPRTAHGEARALWEPPPAPSEKQPPGR